MSRKQNDKKQRGFLARLWRRMLRIFLVMFVAQLLYIVLLKWIYPPITITQLVSIVQGDGLHRNYVNGDQISSNLKLAVVASEDQIFADHSGFDWKSIEKAMAYNKKKPNRIRGASTISQQVAKNVFLWQGRDWLRKGLELYFTKMIEWIWGKKRILNVYLNVIEMGQGIYGAEAAAQHFFNKPAAKLSRRESALIAASLPNPMRFTVKPMSSFVARKSGWILVQMNNLEGDEDLEAIIR